MLLTALSINALKPNKNMDMIIMQNLDPAVRLTGDGNADIIKPGFANCNPGSAGRCRPKTGLPGSGRVGKPGRAGLRRRKIDSAVREKYEKPRVVGFPGTGGMTRKFGLIGIFLLVVLIGGGSRPWPSQTGMTSRTRRRRPRPWPSIAKANGWPKTGSSVRPSRLTARPSASSRIIPRLITRWAWLMPA